MKQLFAYIRVSDPKQKTGVSLTEQRSIIERYAASIGAEISQWFEETRTAAKAGRPVFMRMIKLLRAGRAEGVVIHKLDRGTRNFRDWAEIDELIERGIDVYVANENLDLRSRGGRLAADVQIAVAVDYIRNLREEALKGIHGRLKQGVLPNGAGIGYLDMGAGQPKAIDPKKGPLVKRIFELYATGAHTLRDMAAEAERIGLRNRNGRPLRMQEIHKVLRNPFYAGIIRSKRFGVFPGAHIPLVPQALFDRAQAVLAGKFVRRAKRHEFPFRRFMRCSTCGRSLIGSERKGFVYYRCSTIPCPTTSIREDRVDAEIRLVLRRITLAEAETELLEREIAGLSADDESVKAGRRTSLAEALAAVNARLSRLTDLLLDDKIEPQQHEEKRASLLAERIGLEQQLAALDAGAVDVAAVARAIVGLARSPETLYDSAEAEQKRQLLGIVMSDCVASGKTLAFSVREPFATIANRRDSQSCGQLYDTDRTFLTQVLISWAASCSLTMADALQSISAMKAVKTPKT